MSLISDTSWFTRGLDPGVQTTLVGVKYAPLISRGSPEQLQTSDPLPNQAETLHLLQYDPSLRRRFSEIQLQDLAQMATIRDINGSVIVPSPTTYIELGVGHRMSFDEDTLEGRITPAMSSDLSDELTLALGGAKHSFTGSDVRLMIEIPTVTSGDARPRYAKQLFECTTISVSVHRERAPVRAAGFINPTGFADGKRTIAGTMIMTQFTTEILMRFLQSLLMNDVSKDTHYTKIDQLPMFNLTMLFSNEHGYASFRRLLGAKFVTDGTTYSIQDLMTEQTISYMAMDFTPLIPLTLSNLYQPADPLNRGSRRERSIPDLMQTAPGSLISI